MFFVCSAEKALLVMVILKETFTIEGIFPIVLLVECVAVVSDEDWIKN